MLPKNDFNRKMIDFDTITKNGLRMREIWANYLLPKALKVAQSYTASM